MTVPHPAKFNDAIMASISDVLDNLFLLERDVLDPFAGVGGIHDLSDQWNTYAIELEPEWAAQSAERGPTWCGDFFEFGALRADILHWPCEFNVIVTSPTYGNRMADHHEARDASTRVTYRHKLGRALSDNNSGMMQWGHEYRMFHKRAWSRVADLVIDKGWFLLNVKDHPRGGQLQGVPEWHRANVERRGFVLVEDVEIPVTGMGFGANQHDSTKAAVEHLYVFQRRRRD